MARRTVRSSRAGSGVVGDVSVGSLSWGGFRRGVAGRRFAPPPPSMNTPQATTFFGVPEPRERRRGACAVVPEAAVPEDVAPGSDSPPYPPEGALAGGAAPPRS